MARKLAVIGAGLMGSGIAQVSAQAGWDVVLRDVTDEALTRGTDGIKASYDQFVAKGKLAAADAEAALARITTTTDLDAVADADIVVEAVFEKLEVKHEIFRALDKIVARGRRARLQHLRHPDHQDRGRHRAPGAGRRRALLLAGADDAALRAGPRLQDERRNPRHRTGVRRVRRQDLHRRQPGRRRLRDDPADLGARRRGGQAVRVGRRHRRGHRHSPASWASATPWARSPPPT